MKTSSYFEQLPHSRPRIFAHRGFTLKKSVQIVQENTIQAFELALEAGADYIETDVRATRDGVAILFHDPDLKRLTGKKVKVSDLSYRELSDIKLPFAGKVPTLDEVLERFPTAKLNIDIKSKNAEKIAPEIINQTAAWDRVLISSFSEQSRIRALANLQKSVASSPGSLRVLKLYLQARISSRKLDYELEGLSALQLPTKMYSIDFTNATFLERIFEHDIEVHYWTINTKKEMEELSAIGAHGIVTDRTDLAVDLFC